MGKGEEKSVEIDITGFLRKINLPFVLLALFLIIGFSLRAYHIGYPVIGYHNWKSAHYLSEARNFERDGFFEGGFFVPMRDTMNSINEPPDGLHPDTFPLISIIVGFFFKIFGESLVMARLINILFSLGTIILSYLLVKALFKREGLALIVAFLTAVNPLFVFFSHNVDLINPGVFLMLLGAYLYVKWLETENHAFIYSASFAIALSVITKYSFAVIGIPILFTFPYKKVMKNYKRYLKPFGICIGILSMFPLWFYYSEFYLKTYVYNAGSPLSDLIDFSIIGNSDFWGVMKAYVADNFTLFGMTLAFFGLILLLLLSIKNYKKTGYLFMLGYLAGAVAFLFILGIKLSGHNYHQFPIAPFVIFLIAFFVEVAAKNISSMLKEDMLSKSAYVFIILLMLFAPLSHGKSLSSMPTRDLEFFRIPRFGIAGHDEDSRDRMFDTQFPGLDIAGYYIRDNSLPSERVFHSSHQSFGVLWHAERKGYKPPNSVEEFKRAESDFNVTWILAYQWGIATYLNNPEIFGYLKDNYKLVQFAYVPQGDNGQPVYFLFRKGGTFNESALNDLLSNKQTFKTTYSYTSGPYDLYTINIG